MTSESELHSRLSALPSPPMPDEVAQAIHARLAEAETPTNVVPITRTHRRRLSGLLVAAAVAAFAMLMTVAVEPTSTPVAGGPPIVRAGAIYEPRLFADELSQRYLGEPAAAKPTDTFADSETGIDTCADAVDAFGHVLAVDTGSYDSTAAVVLVTSYPANSEYEEVWVVTPACGPSDSRVIRHMVYDVDHSTDDL